MATVSPDLKRHRVSVKILRRRGSALGFFGACSRSASRLPERGRGWYSKARRFGRTHQEPKATCAKHTLLPFLLPNPNPNPNPNRRQTSVAMRRVWCRIAPDVCRRYGFGFGVALRRAMRRISVELHLRNLRGEHRTVPRCASGFAREPASFVASRPVTVALSAFRPDKQQPLLMPFVDTLLEPFKRQVLADRGNFAVSLPEIGQFETAVCIGQAV